MSPAATRMRATSPPVAWSTGEAVAATAAVVAVAAVGVVWAATQLAALLAAGTTVALDMQAAATATVRIIAHPGDPLAALPADAAATIAATGWWWSAFAVVTAAAAAAIAAVATRLLPAGWESAAWATRRDMSALHVTAAGDGRLVLGRHSARLVAAEPSQAVIVLGPARSGKTAGLAIPAILEWDGPVLATSVRTDLLDATGDARRRRGDVWVYAPTGDAAGGHATHGWNPLDACGDWRGAQRVAASLCSAGRRGAGSGDEQFWYTVAAKLLAPLLYAASAGGYSMSDVVRWVDTQEEIEVRTELSGIGDAAALYAAEATWQREARTRSSAYTTAEVVLHAFGDPTVLAACADAQITADRFLDGGARTLYVCAPGHEQDRLRPVFTALLDHIVARAYARHATGAALTKPLLIVLDEAANIATPRDLDAIASTAAGTGIQLVTIWQDFAQIKARYGDRAATVVNNHRAKLVLSGVSDEPTLKYVSQLVGDHAYRPDQASFDSGGRHSMSTGQPQFRPLAPADALRRIPPDHGLLVYGHLPPARIALRPWFADPHLRRLAEIDHADDTTR